MVIQIWVLILWFVGLLLGSMIYDGYYLVAKLLGILMIIIYWLGTTNYLED